MRKISAYSVIFILLIMNAGCASMLFHPETNFENTVSLIDIPHEDVYFKTTDNLTLHGWLLRTCLDSKGTVIFLHGNDDNISTHAYRALWFLPEGFDVFIFDYRGYGKSEGKPSLKGVHQDALSAIEEVFTLPGINKNRIFVYGQSMGGAVAVYAAANSPYKKNIKALIIDSAYSSYSRIYREHMDESMTTWPLKFWSPFIDNYYSPSKWIKKISPVPLVIIHGDKDTVVPVSHAYTLYKKASEPKTLWIAEGKGHVKALDDEEIRKHLAGYLQNLTHARIDK